MQGKKTVQKLFLEYFFTHFGKMDDKNNENARRQIVKIIKFFKTKRKSVDIGVKDLDFYRYRSLLAKYFILVFLRYIKFKRKTKGEAI